MKKTTALAMVIGFSLALTPAAQAWISYIDFEEQLFPDQEDPVWIECNLAGGCTTQEGGASFVDVGGSIALRLDSPNRSDVTDPPPDLSSNEYYAFRFGETDILAASRFRLVEFTPVGKENLLMVTVGGDMAIAPSITLVDGNYWVWSYTSNEPILDLGPVVAGEWHEAYVLALSDGTARVLWDGAFVLDGPVIPAPNFDGYVEFGSGGYWQGNAGTVVDFDWVGSGTSADLPVPPGLTGDYNDDGKVDAADYVVWRKNEGTLNPLPHDPIGGTIGQGQYDNWRANFGQTAGSGTAHSSIETLPAVPEPATLMISVMAMILMCSLQRARVS